METSEESLILDILAGDANAYAVLVRRYQKPIFNLMLRMTSSKADAADLTQEAFVRAYEKLGYFKPHRSFFPWLYTIGLNLARDFHRRRKTAQAVEQELTDAQNAGDSALAGRGFLPKIIESNDVREALQGLPLQYREALVLRFHQGLAVQEIASALGISQSATKMRIQRGLLKIRECLSKDEPYE